MMQLIFKNNNTINDDYHSFQITYDYLIVALGLDIRFDKVKGLTDTLGKNGVCSNYGAGR